MKRLLEDFHRGNNMIDPAPFFFGYLREHAAYYTADARPELAGVIQRRPVSRRQYFLNIVK